MAARFQQQKPDQPASQDEEQTLLSQGQGMALVGQIAGGILHDFNNVLTVITGTIDILAQAVTDRPELAAVARLIDEAASRGARLTSQLLAFARGRPPQPCQVDINELLTDVGRLLRPTLGSQIEITTEVAAETPNAFADPGQLMAALLCLGITARNAMPEGGALRFEAGCSVVNAADRAAVNCVVISLKAMANGNIAVSSSQMFTQIGMVEDFVRRSNGRLAIEEAAGAVAKVEISLPRAEFPPHG
ncbi:histidine kinase [Bradyrhizobium sp. HKCCYLS1011]|uniref:histidine kinase n=1 Tax=Bradyrhizobium sp. HKCCYLS1011 TaxID=3420733 RepID=UPI003EB72DC1